uniref:CSON006964 protein n=1 Tax=Culicoides sonorensis TaxID=179676 RepID=A0A336MVR9_CULSO
MTTINFDCVYSSLLYQLINSLSLENDKNKIREFTDYLKDIFDYSTVTHNKILGQVRELPKPKRICDLTVIEAIDVHLDETTADKPPRLFVTADFDEADDEIQYTQISNKMVWNETLSLIFDEATMNDCLVVRIWNNYARNEDRFYGQKLLDRILYKPTSSESSVDEIVKAGKRSSYIIGKAVIPMKAITPSIPFTWQLIDKKDPRLRKSVIKLKVDYTLHQNEHFYPDASVEYSVIYEKLLRYELKESKVSGFWWDGKFTKLGQSLLDHYCQNKKLSRSTTRLAQWQVICQIQSSHPLAFSLFDHIIDDLSTFIRNGAYKEKQLSVFWDATVKFLEHSVVYLKNFNFDNEKRTINLLKTIQKISSIVSMYQTGLLAVNMFEKEPISELDKKARNSIEPLITEALTENAKIWFESNENGIERKNHDEEDGLRIQSNPNLIDIKNVSKLLQNVQERLEIIIETYNKPFKQYTNINLLELYMTQLDLSFTEEVQDKIKSVSHTFDMEIDSANPNYDEQKALSDELKLFYMSLKGFNETVIKKYLASSKKSFKVSKFNEWFDDLISIWFKVMGIEARKGIEKAVNLDEKICLEGMRHTSSAGDTYDLLYVFLLEFKKVVATEKGKAFMVATEIVSEITDSCSTYNEYLSNKLDWNSKSTEKIIEKDFIDQFALVVNNLEYLSSKVGEIIEELYIHILDSDDTMITNKKYPGLDDLQSNMNKNLTNNIQKLVTSKISVHIQKLLKDAFAWIGKDIKTFEPVLNYLDEIMSQLGSLLSTESFDKLFNFVWNEILVQLRVWMEKQITSQQDVAAMISFKQFFECIKETFKGAVTNEELQEDLKFLNNELRKRGCSPLEIIHNYYIELISEEENAQETFGKLTFSGTFSQDGLDLHILNGRNLIPKTGIDGDTEPDTYVEVEFYFKDPSKYNLKSMKTKTINKNQFPLYDEILKIPLSPAEQDLDDTIIVFTLWDPDLLGMVQNYLGESSITFKELKDSNGKQIIHNLKKPHDKNNEFLVNLKSRTDKQAKELYKAFKFRCKETTNNKKKSSITFQSLWSPKN